MASIHFISDKNLMTMFKNAGLAFVLMGMVASQTWAQSDALYKLGDQPPRAAAMDPAIAAKVPAEIRRKGTLSAGNTTASRPLHFYGADGRTIIGVDVDLAKAIGQVLGLQVTIEPADMKQLVPGLQSGRYDLTVNQMTPTPERRMVFDFVDYIMVGAALGVKGGRGKELSLNGLGYCGAKVAVISGNSMVFAEGPALSKRCEAAQKPPIVQSEFPDAQTATLAVFSGRMDGFLYPSSAIAAIARETSQMEYDGVMASPAGGIVFPKGSQLVEPVRDALVKLRETGLYAEILKKWGMADASVSEFKIVKATN